MDIYLTNLQTKDCLRFPMLPQEINVKVANQFTNYAIISVGEVRLPGGTSLDGFSWDGILPGAERKSAPYVHGWQDPKAVCKWLCELKAQAGKPVKARLLITETPFNCDVYLDSFVEKAKGGYGDIYYSISLTQAKEIKVVRSSKSESPHSPVPARTSPPAAQTYTVAKGDCLWKIAQKFYGAGAQYTKIYEANKGVIGSNPNLIYPGQVLAIPS